MIVEISVNEVMFDLKNKSHEECTVAFPDAEARYHIEAADHKDDEIKRCVAEAASMLTNDFTRFIQSFDTQVAEDMAEFGETFVYDFCISERRAMGKAQPLADMIHSYIVQNALAKYYANLQQTDMSKVHDALAITAKAEIERLLYTKTPPRA